MQSENISGQNSDPTEDRPVISFNEKPENTTKISLLVQLTLFFIIGVIVTGILAYFSLRRVSADTVRSQKEELARAISEFTISSMEEYPAYEWLLDYWFDNAGRLDIEYDGDEKTSQKAKEFLVRNPGFIISEATIEDIYELSEEDRKIYSEIVYNWMLERLDSTQKVYNIEYLYILSASAEHDNGTFLLSVSNSPRQRGYEFGTAYKLGAVAKATKDQKYGMDLARQDTRYLSIDAGMMDQYTYMTTVDGRDIFIGSTYDISGIDKEIIEKTRSNTLYFVIFQIILSLLCLVLIYYFMLRPLKRVQKNVRDYKYNKDSDRVRKSLATIRSLNEIGALSEDFTDMTAEIDDYVELIRTITTEKERLGIELKLAADIQENALPDPVKDSPGRDEFAVYATMDPAKEVGGDFYDFFMTDDDHVGLVIADVSGKGIPAALFMMVAKSLLKNAAQAGNDPAECLCRVNDTLCENNDAEMFVTVWIGILDLRNGRLVFADAGHEEMLLMSEGSWKYAEKKRKPALAIMPGIRYVTQELTLKPGDSIFQYTDGVTEAANSANELFGTKRLLDSVANASSTEPEQLLRSVRSNIDDFVKDAPQFDDLTMISLLYRG